MTSKNETKNKLKLKSVITKIIYFNFLNFILKTMFHSFKINQTKSSVK